MMAYPQETREKLRRAYIFNQLSLEVAASQIGVAFVTARRWKKEAQDKNDDWDKMRAAHMLAGGGVEDAGRAVLMSLVVQCQAVTEQINTNPDIPADKRVELLASLADAFNKATSASKKILPETDKLATAIDVIQRFGQFISDKYPQHNVVFVEILEAFANELERAYG
ncbi:hypothetical protein NVI2019_OHEONHNH_00854 [Providencia alcalifaciens]|nr:hypothetical protein NVI2019_OHEONHNH_00854 [Providencia alcalifaciens]CAG9416203.1 hypothetical protein NVI2019_KOLGMIGM_01350 [Providencia alcalifaciens]CAG9417188.1 hypothetical protein NVI2019_OGMBKCAO_01350 [Providencia alcalifaciens]CAG9417351.1 hypothetical protein NVI2019_ANGEOOBF_01349 [Providencia alcalifaciens]CAG9424793.1 hypothetical protein NVI2019_PLFLNFOB_02467 [Providencia alcalifaciens]